jgi:threonine dehydrogenase-like Zn-dependent dehydrogenase
MTSQKPEARQLVIPQEMRALVLDGAGWEHLAIRRVPVPRPGPGQLLARVDCAGICTSLLKLIDQGSSHALIYGLDLGDYPAILGDEGALTLVQVGADLRDQYHPGERYVMQPAVEHAPIYRLERYRDNGYGIDKVAAGYTLPGHLAEYILVTEEALAAGCMLPLPDARLAYAHAALTEPLSCAVSSQDHHLHLTRQGPLAPRTVIKGLKPGGVTVIIGGGSMGRMHVDVALSYQPRAIVASDHHDERLALIERLFRARAERAGMQLRLVQSYREDLEAIVAGLTAGLGADDVIVGVGSESAIHAAQGLVSRGGVLNLFGGLPRGREMIPFDTLAIHYKEINVTGSSGGYPWDMARTLELIAAGSIDPAAHITRIGDLEHAADLLKMVKAKTIDGKAVVYPHRRAGSISRVPSWSAEDEQAYLGGAPGRRPAAAA